MHIFCPECGKHIDVSIQEIERLEGHYVCPQCLTEINLDIDTGKKNTTIEPQAPAHSHSGSQDKEINESQAQHHTITASDNASDHSSSSTPPAQPEHANAHDNAATLQQEPEQVDAVIRYCKNCGAFIKEGANFCPKCGKFVRVKPPKYQSQQSKKSSSPPPYKKSVTQDHSQRLSTPTTPMANNKRKSASAKKEKSQFSILSIGGCLALTVIVVALFFIVYIFIGE